MPNKTFCTFVDEMFTGTLAGRNFGHKSGFWISPRGEMVGTSSVHIQDIIDNPSKFGMSLDQIQQIYDRYDEPLGAEGQAREEIIKMAVIRGWIRVRRYIRPDYWSVTVHTMDRKTKMVIDSWVNTFHDNGIMGRGTEIKVYEVKSNRLKTYEVAEILRYGLEENTENRQVWALRESTFEDQPDLPLMDLTESSLSRIWAKTQKHTCGTISGYRNDNSRAQNKANNRLIKNYLLGKGYSVTAISGSYIENFKTKDAVEVKEPSFFVANHKVEGDDGGELEKDLVKLGSMMDQDSILMIPYGGKGAYLRGTTRRDNTPLDYGETLRVGSGVYGKVAGQFLSRIRGRPFAFEEIERPKTRNGKWAQSVIAKMIDEEWEKNKY